VFELTVEASFSAAHQIRGHPGPCARLHGHNYRVEVTVVGPELDARGLLVDFGELRAACRRALDDLDHRFLNDLDAFRAANPTAEALARHLHQRIAQELHPAAAPVRVARVTVWESDTSRATYRGD